jgi:hypothetical protein
MILHSFLVPCDASLGPFVFTFFLDGFHYFLFNIVFTLIPFF